MVASIFSSLRTPSLVLLALLWLCAVHSVVGEEIQFFKSVGVPSWLRAAADYATDMRFWLTARRAETRPLCSYFKDRPERS